MTLTERYNEQMTQADIALHTITQRLAQLKSDSQTQSLDWAKLGSVCKITEDLNNLLEFIG